MMFTVKIKHDDINILKSVLTIAGLDIQEIKKESHDTSTHLLLMAKWNSFANENNLPKIFSLTDLRHKHIGARLAEELFDFDLILQEIKKSSFLLGKNSSWRVTFDFIISSPNNYLKILEGKYRNKIEYNNGVVNNTSSFVMEKPDFSAMKGVF